MKKEFMMKKIRNMKTTVKISSCTQTHSHNMREASLGEVEEEVADGETVDEVAEGLDINRMVINKTVINRMDMAIIGKKEMHQRSSASGVIK